MLGDDGGVIFKRTVFDPEADLEVPEVGYELKSSGSLNTYHHQSREVTNAFREKLLLESSDSMLYGWHGIRHPIQAMLMSYKYGNVRAAMAQQLVAEVLTEHKPFVDLEREEGFTHRVDDPEPVVHGSKAKPQGFEWKTNIYG
jgi:hypothetical protein